MMKKEMCLVQQFALSVSLFVLGVFGSSGLTENWGSGAEPGANDGIRIDNQFIMRMSSGRSVP